MIDLKGYLKLNIQYQDKVYYSTDVIVEKVGDRLLEQMYDVILNNNLTCPNSVYTVLKGVTKAKDKDKWKDMNLRYDMTIMPGNFIGVEYPKTIGHYHNVIKDSGVPAAEILEIVHGSGVIILQKPMRIGKETATEINEMYNFSLIEEIYLLKANRGDKIVIPPGYAHVIVNIRKQPLVVGNIQSIDVQHLYEPIKENHGAAYYVIHKNARAEFVQNPNYRIMSKLKKLKASDFKVPVKIQGKKSIYHFALANPDKLLWLNNPGLINWN